MAFERPTLSTIIQRVEGDIKGALSIVTILRRSFLKAMSAAVGGVSHVLHGHLVFISKQIFPDQAEDEFVERWGSIYGMERNPATFTQLNIDIVFTGAGTLVAGTVYQRTDGATYTLNDEVSATGAGTESGVITAEEAGDAGNLDTGETVSLQSAVANVEGDATVSSTAVEGADEEENDSFRSRIVKRIQNPPSGGTVADYEQFALDAAADVSRAWVFPGYRGEGTCDVAFMQTDNGGEQIPGAAKVQEVEDYIISKKPVTANHNTFAPIDNSVDFDIAIDPNTSEVQAAITAELEDLFLRESQVRGAYKTVTTTYDGKIRLSRISEAISVAEDEEAHEVNSPTSDPEPATDGGILTLGTITFSTLV
jgi:uncharacterized phage protein gp47/JayE